MSDRELPPVVDNPPLSRFELSLDGHLAELEYILSGDQLILLHTEVPDALEGHGVGGALVRAAVESADKRALTLVPRCSFARSWLEEHPDVARTVTVQTG